MSDIPKSIKNLSRKLLTRTEEQELFKRYGRGDLQAKEKLIEHNLGLVVREAGRRQHTRHFDINDLISEGVIGLMRAIEKYEWERGHKFSSYAVPWIKQAIQRAIDNKSRTVRLPVNDAFTAHQMKKYRNEVAVQEGREPTDEELKAKFKLEDWRFEYIERWQRGTLPSLNAVYGKSDTTELGDLIPNELSESPEQSVVDTGARQYIRQRVDELEEPARSVIIMRFGLDGEDPASYDDTSKMLEISDDKVQAIEKDVLLRWRFDEGIRSTKRMPAPRGTTCKRGHVVTGDRCDECRDYGPYIKGKTCKAGHPWGPGNDKLRANGRYECKVCRKLRDKERANV